MPKAFTNVKVCPLCKRKFNSGRGAGTHMLWCLKKPETSVLRNRLSKQFSKQMKEKNLMGNPIYFERMREAKKGKPTWNKCVTGYTTSWKGGKMPESGKMKMRENHYSKTHPKLFKLINDRTRPKSITKYEKMFEKKLQKNKIKYEAQYIVGKYCCDFFIPSFNTIIEIDGYKKTDERTNFIKSKGHRLISIKNKDVKITKVGDLFEK